MQRSLGMLLLAVALSGGARRGAAQALEERTLDVGGLRRSYLLYRPPGARSAALPLVLVFHGGSGTARGIAGHTGFTRLAARQRVLVVYPQGIGQRWNDGRGIHRAYDDVGFIRALLDTLPRELAVDERRIYAAGISNGAVFTHRLACELPGTFAAIAAVAGTFPAPLETRCAGAAPVAVVTFQGTADRLMPYQEVAERTAAFWARVNGCTGPPHDSLLPEHHRDGTRVRQRSYTECRSGRPVVLYRIDGGGHTWPGGPAAGSSVGRVSREIDATAAIWQFFTASPPASRPSSPTPSTTRRSSSPSRSPTDR